MEDKIESVEKVADGYKAESVNGLRAWGDTEEQARLNLIRLIEKEETVI